MGIVCQASKQEFRDFMELAFIGTGYVGLVTGVMMSHIGHDVTCIDVNQEKIDLLNNGKSPIYENELDNYLSKQNKSGKLHFTDKFDSKLAKQDAVFITVGTPSDKNGNADLSYVYNSIDRVLEFISGRCILVIKSTVPPGTTKEIQNYVREKGKSNPIANNPEFLREGSAVYDFLNPDRIVVGVESTEASSALKDIYAPMTKEGVKLVSTDFATSELIKYASNTFLANKIAFINEMSDICEHINANIKDLSYGLGLDKRIGDSFLNAGPGFGGSCFPKDILALQSLTNNLESRSLILDAVVKANSERPANILQRIDKLVGGLNQKTVAVLGLTYKAGTDDLRSSPALEMIKLLKDTGAIIQAYDPMGGKNAKQHILDSEIKQSALDACKNADFILCLTEWSEFNELNFDSIKDVLKGTTLIDLRNFLDQKKITNAGLKYYTIGVNLSNGKTY